MLFEDKEVNLIDDFRLAVNSSLGPTVFFSSSDLIDSIVDSLVDDKRWKTEWIDTSAKDVPPPDFVNNQSKIMLEVMRIDDHEFQKKGKRINPTNQKARKIEKETQEMIDEGILHVRPDAQLIVTCTSGLPSLEDHNYTYYLDGFRRIVNKHISKIPLYRNNHPDYTLVFFVFDESSMYCKMDEPNRTIKKGEFFSGSPHFWFYDRAFLDVIKDSGIDYFIWFTPYKTFDLIVPPLELPIVCVFDCNNIPDDLIDFDPIYMMSVEE